MALDYGRRRIGVAASDPTHTIASPHSVVPNGGDPDRPPDELLRLLEELEAETVVLGIPREMDGTTGEMASEVERFGERLAERTGLPVVEWDERLSSEAARRELLESDAPERIRREKGRTDMVAASLLLKAYLSSRGSR